MESSLLAKVATHGTFAGTRYELNKETNKVEAKEVAYWTTGKLDGIFDKIKMLELKKKFLLKRRNLTFDQKMELAKNNKELNKAYQDRDKEKQNIIISWNNTAMKFPGMSDEEIARRASVRRVSKGYGKIAVPTVLTSIGIGVSVLTPIGLFALGGTLTATGGTVLGALSAIGTGVSQGALTAAGGSVLGATAMVAGTAGGIGATSTATQMVANDRLNRLIEKKEEEMNMYEWEEVNDDLFKSLRTGKIYVKEIQYKKTDALKKSRKFEKKDEASFVLLKKEIARIQDKIRSSNREYDILTSEKISKLREETEKEMKRLKKDKIMNILLWSSVSGGLSAVFSGIRSNQLLVKAAEGYKIATKAAQVAGEVAEGTTKYTRDQQVKEGKKTPQSA